MRIPIPFRIRPPTISIRFPKVAPMRLPIIRPTNERRELMIPIARLEVTMFTLTIARLNPTARASMLVAIASKTRVPPRDGSV